MSRRWASGGPRSPVTELPAADPKPPEPAKPTEPAMPAELGIPAEPAIPPELAIPPEPAKPSAAPGTAQVRLAALAERAAAVAAAWAPTTGRILLGVVFAWFGYHELLLPGQWTQYLPVVSESSSLAIILVLAHGWVLFVLAAALVAGIAPRAAAAIASVLMLEIVISLAVTGLSDTTLRDVGVLGLAVCLTGCKNQRLVLRD
jgi:uncharacterized membrane protein YphA (DoxX/SURF4 family)